MVVAVAEFHSPGDTTPSITGAVAAQRRATSTSARALAAHRPPASARIANKPAGRRLGMRLHVLDFITVSFLLKRFHRKKRLTAHDISLRQDSLVSVITSFSIAHFRLHANRLRCLGCRSRPAGRCAGLCGGVSSSGQSHSSCRSPNTATYAPTSGRYIRVKEEVE